MNPTADRSESMGPRLLDPNRGKGLKRPLDHLASAAEPLEYACRGSIMCHSPHRTPSIHQGERGSPSAKSAWLLWAVSARRVDLGRRRGHPRAAARTPQWARSVCPSRKANALGRRVDRRHVRGGESPHRRTGAKLQRGAVGSRKRLASGRYARNKTPVARGTTGVGRFVPAILRATPASFTERSLTNRLPLRRTRHNRVRRVDADTAFERAGDL